MWLLIINVGIQNTNQNYMNDIERVNVIMEHILSGAVFNLKTLSTRSVCKFKFKLIIGVF